MTERQETEPKPRSIRIGILGTIGVGKSTLAAMLGGRWGVTPVTEVFEENPYLKLFYENPTAYSFHSQVWFLEKKVEQLASLNSENTQIVDPALEMDSIYAMAHHRSGWMTDHEWALYKQLFRTLTTKNEAKPISTDFYIIVKASPEIIRQRIAERGRDFESRIGPEYTTLLDTCIDEWRQTIGNIPAIDVNLGYYDLVDNKNNGKEQVLGRIEGTISVFLHKDPRSSTGERIIGPSFPERASGVDISPALSPEERMLRRR